jgi:hypothetical protein
MLGKLLSLPFRILNTPIRAGEKIVAQLSGDYDIRKEDRIFSVPLDKISEALEEIDKP